VAPSLHADKARRALEERQHLAAPDLLPNGKTFSLASIRDLDTFLAISKPSW